MTRAIERSHVVWLAVFLGTVLAWVVFEAQESAPPCCVHAGGSVYRHKWQDECDVDYVEAPAAMCDEKEARDRLDAQRRVDEWKAAHPPSDPMHDMKEAHP